MTELAKNQVWVTVTEAQRIFQPQEHTVGPALSPVPISTREADWLRVRRARLPAGMTGVLG